MESLARNAFLSYDKLDSLKLWHLRWWLFAAIQRQVVDKFKIRKDGTVSIAPQNWLRLDPEQFETDNEVSYYRQVVQRAFREIAENWEWSNIINFQTRRPLLVFAQGQWQKPSSMPEKQQVELLCELNLQAPEKKKCSPCSQEDFV